MAIGNRPISGSPISGGDGYTTVGGCYSEALNVELDGACCDDLDGDSFTLNLVYRSAVYWNSDVTSSWSNDCDSGDCQFHLQCENSTGYLWRFFYHPFAASRVCSIEDTAPNPRFEWVLSSAQCDPFQLVFYRDFTLNQTSGLADHQVCLSQTPVAAPGAPGEGTPSCLYYDEGVCRVTATITEA